MEIKVVCHDESVASEAIDKAFSKMREIERVMSSKDPNSLLSLINREAAQHDVLLPHSLIEVIDQCLHYSSVSEGAFDISIGSITQLWNFRNDKPLLPSTESIQSAKAFVNYKLISLDKEQGIISLKKEGMFLDLGGVAKGYGIDQGAEVLKRYGISSGIINAGGDLMVFGKKPDHAQWRIGIQHPRKKNRIIENIKITDKAIVTSGDYERYFIINNIRYHHILDPTTGWPARKCQSVSIISHDAFSADIIATAVFVLGPDRGMEFIESISSVEGMIIDSKGSSFFSSGWKKGNV